MIGGGGGNNTVNPGMMMGGMFGSGMFGSGMGNTSAQGNVDVPLVKKKYKK